MNKRFIDIKPMQAELLKLLEEKFLSTTHYNSDNISLNLSLKETVEEVIKSKNLVEPKIYILDTAWVKIQKLVAELSSEVAWHCLVEEHPNGVYLIYDILVFPQEVTGVTANGIDGEYEMWLATLPDEEFEHCKCHMHSHVNMGVTPSGTDENYYANLMTQVETYYITMIINKTHTYYLRFYDKQNNIVYDNLTFTVCDSKGNTYDNWFDTVKDKIKTRPAVETKRYDSIFNKPYGSGYSSTLTSSATKKKEAQQEKTISSMTTGSKHTNATTKDTNDSQLVISDPTGALIAFKDNNEAANYIFNYYVKPETVLDPKLFNRNKIRTNVALREKIYIIKDTLEILEDIDADYTLTEYVHRYCDLWEPL